MWGQIGLSYDCLAVEFHIKKSYYIDKFIYLKYFLHKQYNGGLKALSVLYLWKTIHTWLICGGMPMPMPGGKWNIEL